MKVLHVIHALSPKYGGPSQALVAMCRGLRARGVEVQIVCTNAEPGGRLPVETETLTTFQGLPVIFFKARGLGAFDYSSGMVRWLNENVSGFDLVHIHGVFSHAGLAAAAACRKHAVPYIVRPVGHIEPWALAQKPGRKKIFLRLGGANMLHRAAAIHYCCVREKEDSEKALRMNHGVVIPLGVELEPATESTRAADERANGKRPYVLMLSRLQPTKGIDTLLNAFLDARQYSTLSDWQLLIAGDGSSQFQASLERTIKERNAGDSVQLTGWLDGEAKRRALAGAALLALPSHHESFGLCVVEAMAQGVPVLVSPEVGVAADVQATGAGWVSSLEPESLGRTLVAALSDPEERRRRGEAGRALSRKFDWTNVAAMLEGLYESLLTSPNVK
jgi:glycosyltransferase involved in cell wall biosynthesis